MDLEPGDDPPSFLDYLILVVALLFIGGCVLMSLLIILGLINPQPLQ